MASTITSEKKQATTLHGNGHHGNGAFHLENVVPYYYTTALRLVKVPKLAQPLARSVAVLMTVALIIAFIPNTWQQNVGGSGIVTSFAPDARPQTIDAQIDGRIVKWYVYEGALVKKGDTIAQLRDIDTKYLAGNFVELQSAVRNNTASEQELEIVQAQNKVLQAEQKYAAALATAENARFAVEIAKVRFYRADSLEKQGLIARRDLESARLSVQKEEAEYAKAMAQVRVERQAVKNAEAELGAKRRKAQAVVAKADLELGNVSVRKDLATIISPVDGQVTRIAQAGAAQNVKKGDRLAIVTPTTDDIAAEIFVSSLDAAIIDTGRPVRLQFAGFPAIQPFGAGMPNISIGTFGGIVSVIDAVDDGSGKYRVLVRPDPNDKPWPNRAYLRQGTEVSGWVMLNEVSLIYEAWRQLNGFPQQIPVKGGMKEKKSKSFIPAKDKDDKDNKDKDDKDDKEDK